MKQFLILLFIIGGTVFGQYAPPVGQVGTTAIHKDSSIIVGWANRVEEFNPGPQNISNGTSPLASFGNDYDALGYAEGDGMSVVSLGDSGSIVLGFTHPIMNGSGPDFCVFENSFDDVFLEFAHVEVSTDGINFVRFPSHSLVQTDTQTNGFGNTNTEEIHNLAGKYRQGYGTPFDLEDLVDSTGINLDSINYVKIVDVVGSIDPEFGTYDSYGNIINDPFPTEFEQSGFDLDGIGLINVNGTFEVGVDEYSQSLNVYPNPTNGVLYCDSEVPLNIYDATGKLILKTDPEMVMIDFTEFGLKPGVYFIITDEELPRKEKIILTKN